MFNFRPNNYMNPNSIKSKHERLLGTPGTSPPHKNMDPTMKIIHGSHSM